ncbi:hypothetical protein [Undibacterium sp. Di24W]|uniref:hypothetical protein n=1 Tax=Undibacterium sp. Di24W TaxID=3413033 RepID=UPI003BF58601
MCAFGRHALAQSQSSPTIRTFYPDIGEPYKSIFAKIMDGIDERLPKPSLRIAISTESNSTNFPNLRESRPSMVIALGRAGLKAAMTLEGPVEIIGGGVISPSDADSKITLLQSLAPDPGLLFARLRQLQPNGKRIYVVYSAVNSGWLMRFADAAARTQGFELKGLEASDLRSAMQRYQELWIDFNSTDALWLPQDPITSEESTIVPTVLKEAWNRNGILFSSNLAHVRRGALFALFPNNIALGQRLGSAALAHLTTPANAPRGIVPLRELFASLNTRTASHLGIEYAPKLHGNFDLLLPER